MKYTALVVIHSQKSADPDMSVYFEGEQGYENRLWRFEGDLSKVADNDGRFWTVHVEVEIDD